MLSYIEIHQALQLKKEKTKTPETVQEILASESQTHLLLIALHPLNVKGFLAVRVGFALFWSCES